MGVLFDYFVASSDEAAAAVIDEGPAVPVASGQQKGLRRMFGRQSAPSGSQPLPVVDGRGVDPSVHLGTLEALLTGRSYEELLQEGDPDPVAVRDEGERLVLPLRDELVRALVAASEQQLAEVAPTWSRSEDFWGSAEPFGLEQFARDLAELARGARERQERLYCWVCV